ncbi:response regulator [Nitratidesulfovibrio vulgaris]|uniref:Response regulator n=1 Tax=Nitratidesulfovibrio vulgaris (strain ATCC 29579 / DSM 644 / CCUG 34227 / NCIMB 8303 / VKM B-1760 / Hildenborough) TaxID=882 RepID=Q72WF2_NITV2|nr:response regulator transcription factor [Nitratidesulfovibrio vulgaris]AAS94474.1 response regulator [Nitratidesulfovibrio vulgaris str. Hildenborough]ADP88379.1 two component transcriptional regulator, LuxR family [Nitratidesulfovibrio vulgaris RCH1]
MLPVDPSPARADLRFLLIDDHPAVRQGLNLLLESHGYTPGVEAATRADAKGCLEQATFDLALLDLSLADGSGLDLLADLAEHGVRILVYSMHEDPGTIDRALRCGANGYVTKREDPSVLLEGIEGVLRGERFVSERAGSSLDETAGARAMDPLFLLSDQERAIFSAVGRGESNMDVAGSLGISPRTVETYLARMVNKLGLSNVRTLRKFAINWRE